MVGYAIHMKEKNRKKKKPEWLGSLLKSVFFGSCLDHQDLRKNESNVFCIDCELCLCHHCLSPSSPTSSHSFHNLLRIRRYVYNDVVRLHDIQKHLDCSRVQTYTTNDAKVVFLNPRPQLKPSRSNNGASCEVCERSLTEPNIYCSVACKISVVSEEAKNSSSSSPLNPLRIPDFSDLYVKEKENQDLETKMKDEEDEEAASALTEEESSEENQAQPWLNSSALKPKRQLHKRKGAPRRAHFY